MIDLMVAVSLVVLSGLCLSLAWGIFRFLLTDRPRVLRKVGKMGSGIYVKHGMTIDPDTGEVRPTSSPSERAWRDKLKRLEKWYE